MYKELYCIKTVLVNVVNIILYITTKVQGILQIL